MADFYVKPVRGSNLRPEITGEFLEVCRETAVTGVSAPWDPTDGKSACHNRHNQ